MLVCKKSHKMAKWRNTLKHVHNKRHNHTQTQDHTLLNTSTSLPPRLLAWMRKKCRQCNNRPMKVVGEWSLIWCVSHLFLCCNDFWLTKPVTNRLRKSSSWKWICRSKRRQHSSLPMQRRFQTDYQPGLGCRYMWGWSLEWIFWTVHRYLVCFCLSI